MDKKIPGEASPLQDPFLANSSFATPVNIGGIRHDQIELEKAIADMNGNPFRRDEGNVIYDSRLNADLSPDIAGHPGVPERSDGDNLAELPTELTRKYYGSEKQRKVQRPRHPRTLGRKALRSLKETGTYMLSDNFSPAGLQKESKKPQRKIPLGIFRPLN